MRYDRRFLEQNGELLMGMFESELTQLQKEYMTLYYVGGLTMREIARRSGVNVSTVSRTISRGVQKLKRSVEYARRLAA